MGNEKCDRYKCDRPAVGTGYGAPACYYHESQESYLSRMRTLEEKDIPSTVSPNDPTWRNP